MVAKFLLLVSGLMLVVGAFLLMFFAMDNMMFGLTWEYMTLAFLLFLAGVTFLVVAAKIRPRRR